MPPKDRTRRRVEPRQSRAQGSVDAILTAAQRVLREKGYAKTTTNRIAEVAGVNIALLYRYFAGKEAVVGALVERAAAETLAAFQQTLEAQASSPLPVALRAVIEVLVATPGLPPELHAELVQSVELTRRRAVVEDLRVELGAAFAGFLTKRRDVRELEDPQATMFVVQHAVEAATHAIAFGRPRSLSSERAIAALLEMLISVLSARGGKP